MARSAFKAFLNLLPVLPALLVAFSCSREECGPSAEGISHNGREDGRLVFRAAASDTKAPAFFRDTVLALTENGEKSPFSLKVSTGNRAVASEGTKPACDPYGSNNLPASFTFTIYSEDGGVARIDSDIAERNGDRWISRKDWSEKIPAYTNTPTICAFVNDDVTGQSDIGVYVVDSAKYFYAVLANEANVSGDLYNDFYTPDFLWGYGEYSGLRADNSITFRHVGAALCVHCAPALDMSVTGVELVARLNGYMEWRATDTERKYSDAAYSSDAEAIYGYPNISLSNGDTWIISKDAPVILPPQRGIDDGNEIYLRLYVAYNGDAHALEADISDIEFYSGSMTTLEVTMDSFLWIDAPDAACVWALNGEGAYASNSATATITTNISSSDFANRAVNYAGRYCVLSENADPARLAFTPRWNNFTDTDWTENYTVSCSGVSSSGTVTVEGGHASWGIESWNVPRYLFLGKTYDTDVRVRDINTNVVYKVAPFLMDWNYDDTYIGIADGIITPVAQTPSVQTLEGTVNAGGSYLENSFSAPYEVITPFLYCNPPYMEFAANQAVRTAVTGISRELRDTLVDGRRLWIVPEDITVTFSVPEGTAKFSVGIEYYAYSGNRSLDVNFGGTNLSVNCQPGHHGDMSTTAYYASFSSASITAVGGPVAVDLFTIYKQISMVYSKDTWAVSSKPDWVMTWPDVGQPMGSTSNTPSTNNIFAVVLPNTTGQARGGYITLSTTDGSDLTDTIAVTQAAGSGWDFGGGSGWGTGGGTEVGF